MAPCREIACLCLTLTEAWPLPSALAACALLKTSLSMPRRPHRSQVPHETFLTSAVTKALQAVDASTCLHSVGLGHGMCSSVTMWLHFRCTSCLTAAPLCMQSSIHPLAHPSIHPSTARAQKVAQPRFVMCNRSARSISIRHDHAYSCSVHSPALPGSARCQTVLTLSCHCTVRSVPVPLSYAWCSLFCPLRLVCCCYAFS